MSGKIGKLIITRTGYNPKPKHMVAKLKKVAPLKKDERPRRVDFQAEPDDHLCAIMALNGASTKWIMEKTGLTAGQVSYRIRKAGFTPDSGLSRKAFRDGKSPFSEYVMENVMLSREMDRRLLRLLEDQA
jgi:hypothetical protein